MAAGALDEDFYLYGDQLLKSPEDERDKTKLRITENGTERPTTPTLDDEMDSLLGAAPQVPISKIVSNAPDLQPKAPAAAAQETKDGEAEDTASEEPEDAEDDEESESDDDDVQITIDAIQPTAIPYGHTPSYTRMTLQPGGGAGPGMAKKVDLDAVPQIGGQSIYEVELDPDKPWKMPGADVTDYFNYGFTEETWKMYCEKQRKMRGEVASLNKIVVHSHRGGPLNSSDIKNVVLTPTGNFSPMLSGPPPPPGPMYPPPPPAPEVGTPTMITPGPGATPPRGHSEDGGKTPDADDQVSDGRATPGIDMETSSSAGKPPLLPPPVSGPAVLPSMPPPPPFALPPPGFPGIRGQDNVAAAMAAMFGVRPPEVMHPPMHPGMPPFPPPGFHGGLPGGMPGPEGVMPPYHGVPPPFHMHGDRGPGPMDHMVPPEMMPPGMPGQFPWDPTLGPPPPDMMEGFPMRPDRRSGSRTPSSSASRSRSRSRSSSFEDRGRSNRRRRHRRDRRSKSRSHSRERHRSSRYHRSDHHRSDRHRDRDRDRERERDRDRDRDRERDRDRDRDRDREKRRRDRKEKEERSRHERSSRRHRSSSRDREEERSSRKDKSKSSGDKEPIRESRSRSQTPTS